MKVQKDFPSYNARRFSKPWGAIVRFQGANFSYDFSAASFLGEHKGGNGEGCVVVDCQPGQIVAFGQKDNRGGNRTENDWAIVESDGTLRPVSRKEGQTQK